VCGVGYGHEETNYLYIPLPLQYKYLTSKPYLFYIFPYVTTSQLGTGFSSTRRMIRGEKTRQGGERGG